jgi:hypothetical protein
MLDKGDYSIVRELFLNILKKSFIFFPSQGEMEFISGIDTEKKQLKICSIKPHWNILL